MHETRVQKYKTLPNHLNPLSVGDAQSAEGFNDTPT